MDAVVKYMGSSAAPLSILTLVLALLLCWYRRRRGEPHDQKLTGPRPDDKVVYFVRHGQAWHNQLLDWNLPDPELTPKGEEQSFSLQSGSRLAAALSADAGRRAELLVVSPLRRTLQTALVGFGDLKPPLPWLLEPDIQEKNAVACDTAVLELGAACLETAGRADLREQYERLPEGWHRKEGVYAPDDKLLQARFKRFAERLRDRPERIFIVVTHDHMLAGGLSLERTSKFANGEVRPYALTPRGQWRALPPEGSWLHESRDARSM